LEGKPLHRKKKRPLQVLGEVPRKGQFPILARRKSSLTKKRLRFRASQEKKRTSSKASQGKKKITSPTTSLVFAISAQTSARKAPHFAMGRGKGKTRMPPLWLVGGQGVSRQGFIDRGGKRPGRIRKRRGEQHCESATTTAGSKHREKKTACTEREIPNHTRSLSR